MGTLIDNKRAHYILLGNACLKLQKALCKEKHLKVHRKAHCTQPCVPIFLQLSACSGWLDRAVCSHDLTVSWPCLSVHATAASMASPALPGWLTRLAIATQ